MNKYETERLIIEPFNEEFVERVKKSEFFISRYEEWFSDPKVTEHNSHGLFPEDENGFLKEISKGNIICYAIITKEKRIHIGNMTLQRIDWINRSAEMAIVIGEPSVYGKGYATEALEVLFDHGFLNMNLHRIWSGTSGTNRGMRLVMEKLEMRAEGIFREAVFLDGNYQSVYEHGILQEEWMDRKFRK